MRITRYITGAALAASLLIPSISSAQDIVRLGNVIVASGFCTVASDNTVGVKLDGSTSYTQWLALYALGDDRLKLAMDQYKVTHPKASELETAQYAAQLRKLEAQFQRNNVDLGQKALCR